MALFDSLSWKKTGGCAALMLACSGFGYLAGSYMAFKAGATETSVYMYRVPDEVSKIYGTGDKMIEFEGVINDRIYIQRTPNSSEFIAKEVFVDEITNKRRRHIEDLLK